MTKYLDKEFAVALGSQAYRDNWDAVFGKKDETPSPTPERTSEWWLNKARLEGDSAIGAGVSPYPNHEWVLPSKTGEAQYRVVWTLGEPLEIFWKEAGGHVWHALRPHVEDLAEIARQFATMLIERSYEERT